jgi:hypothetical protein
MRSAEPLTRFGIETHSEKDLVAPRSIGVETRGLAIYGTAAVGVAQEQSQPTAFDLVGDGAEMRLPDKRGRATLSGPDSGRPPPPHL